MAKSFTQNMSWLHTWSGLFFGWLLVPIFITGSICVYWFEISVWARPENHVMREAEPAALVEFSEAYLKKTAPDSRFWKIGLPATNARDPILYLSWMDKQGKLARAQFNADGSGDPIRTDTIGGRFFVNFHYILNDLPRQKNSIGLLLVGAASIVFLAGVISGVVVHKRIFKDFFTFRPQAKSRQRTWLDAHNVLSVLPLPFHFLIVLTGMAYLCYAYIPSGIATLYKGSEPAFRVSADFSQDSELVDPAKATPGPIAPNLALALLHDRAVAGELRPEVMGYIVVRDPGRANAVVEMFGAHRQGIFITNSPRVAFDGVSGRVIRAMHARPPISETWDVIAGLHMAFFGGGLMRLLYLVSGVAGAVMMATGQLLFTIKRREQAVSPAAERFYAIVDRINVATMAGACFACIAHLWAIRLLPFEMAGRAAWEVNVFWFAWALAFLHAALRPPKAAWVEQLAATAVLCVFLPVLGYLVPNSGLLDMIARGDWKTAGVDLASLGCGLFIGWMALLLSGERLPRAARKSSLVGA